MFSKVVLVGRLTKDPEVRTATSGNTVCSFTVAVDNKLRNADGERTSSFIGCVTFGKIAENVSKSLKKGSLVGVDGSLNQRKYDRQDGTKASIIEVICDSVTFLEPKNKGGYDVVPPFDDAPAPVDHSDNDAGNEDNVDNIDSIDINDEGLPF